MPEAFAHSAPAQAGQLALLRLLLPALVPDNRFYSCKFAGLDLSLSSLADFSARFPFTTKSELVRDQESLPPYGSNLTFPLENYTRFHQTSGTSGRPLRWLDTPESWSAMVNTWVEVFHAAGVSSRDRIYFAFSFGPFLGFWTAFEAGQRVQALCLPGGGLSSAARLRAILDNEVSVLCCTPTYAIRLAEVAAQENLSLAGSRVRTLIVAGEPGGSIPATRLRLESLWPGARVFDHHGMTEVGPVTYECPAQPCRLHVLESAFLAEIIRPGATDPVAPGQTGELVLTTLLRPGSPLLRYRTGDLVRQAVREPGQPCACGRFDLSLEGGILGRADDMVVVRGVNLYPSALEEVLRHFGEIAEYQVVVSETHSLTEVSVQLEARPDSGQPQELARKVAVGLQSAFSLRMPVTLVPPGSLPRYEMKAQRWRRMGTGTGPVTASPP